jgi:ABC-type uncharacterized transport system permease subunit
MSTPALSPVSSEVPFYTDEQGVRVTNTRLIVGNTTFAMASITSVSRMVEEPNRAGPIVTGLVGLVVLVIGAAQTPTSVGVIAFGVVVIAAAVAWWILQKTLYGVRVASSSGESRFISSNDGKRVDSIVQAVNDAVISRG